jgi:hypothetical protein
MSIIKKLSPLLLAAIFMFSCSSQSDAITESADTIYFGSNIFSFNGHISSNAEAVAVKGGKVIYIGSRASAEKFRGSDTELYDLGQKTFFADLLTNTASRGKHSGSLSGGNYPSFKSLPKLEKGAINP